MSFRLVACQLYLCPAAFSTPRFVQLCQEIRLSTSLLRSLQIQTFFIKNLSLSLNTMFIVDKHCSDICCDEFLVVPQIYHKRKYVKEQ